MSLKGAYLGQYFLQFTLLSLLRFLKKYSVKYKLYADDTQIYLVIENMMVDSLTTRLPINDMKMWMSRRRLESNVSKTKCMLIGTPRGLERFANIEKIDICNDSNGEIEWVNTVNNLGVLLDSNLSMNM